MVTHLAVDRRGLLKGAGALIVSFGLSSTLGRAAALAVSWPTEISKDLVDSFLAIAADGSVTAFCGHVDLGTGIQTALGQIVAEELDVAFEQVTMVLGDTDKTPDQGGTWASETIQFAAQPLRQAAAEARAFLLGLAEVRLATAKSRLAVTNGVVHDQLDPTHRVAYGELIGGKQFKIGVMGIAEPKSPDAYTIVGRPIRRIDTAAKVTGSFEYVHDVRLPGMLHGRVVLPPAVGTWFTRDNGGVLDAVDESSISHIPGLVQVVVQGNFVGVVAEREEQAIRAAQELRVTWKATAELPEQNELHEVLRESASAQRVLFENGNPDAVSPDAGERIAARYLWPFQMHGSIGPSCGVADVRDDAVEIWSGTQRPHGLREDIALLLDVPADRVRVLRREAAGCYGRNCADDAAADAALLSKAVGRPVRVQLSRADEHGWDPKGVAMVIDIDATLAADGTVGAWKLETGWLSGFADTLPLVLLGKRAIVGFGKGWMNAVPPYSFANGRVIVHEGAPTILRTAWLRGVAAMPNTFAIESFVDDIATRNGSDPIDFRLRHLSDPRAIAVIKAAARRAGWTPRAVGPTASGEGETASGRGFAYARYTHTHADTLVPGAYVAIIAEVEVNRDTGEVRVTRVTVAQDCGLIVNPDGVTHQVHGNVIQSVSRTLKEEVTFDRSGVTSLDWASYPILTFPEVPEIEVELIDRPHEHPDGAGEAASVPMSGAIANAIFDATGARLRQVPFTPARVKAALHGASRA